jgi:hypothetical protein
MGYTITFNMFNGFDIPKDKLLKFIFKDTPTDEIPEEHMIDANDLKDHGLEIVIAGDSWSGKYTYYITMIGNVCTINNPNQKVTLTELSEANIKALESFARKMGCKRKIKTWGVASGG